MNTPISFYQHHFNLADATWTRIEHVDAMVALVYKIVPRNGNPLIIKICPKPDHFVREEYCLRHLAGTISVPHLIDTVQPTPGIDGALLMEYLPGDLLNAHSCTDTLAYALGAMLATLHGHRMQGYGDLTQLETLYTDPRIYFNERFEKDLKECTAHLPPEIIYNCRRYHDTHLDLLLAVDGPCLTHRDFRPGNIIVHNGKLQGIIDWSGARASFAEEDFGTIEYSGWQRVAPAMKTSLLAGYASIRPLPDYQRAMPLIQLNRALATISFLHKRGSWNTTHTALYRLYRSFVETL